MQADFTELPNGPDTNLCKVIFVGASGTGKTALIKRLFSDQFEQHQPATVGVDFFFKRYLFDGRSVGVTLWDTAGQESFQSITSSYYRGSQGAVFVYDVTRPDTLKAIVDFWLPEFDRYSTHRDAVKMIVGNKIDKDLERQVTSDEGALIARDHGCLYYETSAKADLHVQDAVVWGLLAQIIDTPSLLRPPAATMDMEQHDNRGADHQGSCGC
jgi:Ras-related protein Rab-18